MTNSFGEMLHYLRSKNGLSQRQLAEQLCVGRASIANWETNRRMPNAATISQIAHILGVDVADLLFAAEEETEVPNVLLVDDNPIILQGSIPILQETLPETNIIGLSKPVEVLEFFQNNPVALIFLDIELGRTNGLELCRELLQIRPRTNVVYLTAYRKYSFDAWDTGACGFLLKPLEAEDILRQLPKLKYPVRGIGS